MRAIVFDGKGQPLRLEERSRPEAEKGELLLKVLACGICRTDLHIVDGELTEPVLPLVLGHQVVGEVVAADPGVGDSRIGEIVGVPWLGGTCGACPDCCGGRENLCPDARFTGYQRDGGFAEYCTADETFCFTIPSGYPPRQAAPLLCAGLIGYRSLRIAGEGQRVGLYGFGAAAHIAIQVLRYQGREGYAFTREGDEEAQVFARRLGASWAGASTEKPPISLDTAILFAPVGELVPLALAAVRPGGRVVCGGIHMSDIPSFPYRLLWEERSIHSVANLTRRDSEEFLALAPEVPVRTEVIEYALEDAERALDDLREGKFQGAAVVIP
jgi:alcohol dehydrogenase, propanol-preferring